MQFTQITLLSAAVLAGSALAAPGVPGCYPTNYYQKFHPSYNSDNVVAPVENAGAASSYYPSSYYNNYPYNGFPTLSRPNFYNAYDKQQAEYQDTDAHSENQNANENAVASENLAGAKSENANENANLAKGGEAFGFGALESDNRNLLANENNIEVANANKNELGVEVANFNANENSAEQESAALAEVMNEDMATFTDVQENETDNFNLNDNLNDRLNGGCGSCRGFN